MCLFSAGPLNTMSRSAGESSQNGTSVRTPMAPHTCFMRSHISEPQTTTAPSSMVLLSSGTSAARFTVRAIPVPPQVGQAPSLLKASCSAPGPKNLPPQRGHEIASSAATFKLGGTCLPQCGHTWLPTREKRSRRLFNSSLEVPNVERTPGTAGRWCSARAAGTKRTSSTEALPA